MLKAYPGSCHCGGVTFEAELDLDRSSYRCNCSICRRTRFWPAVASPDPNPNRIGSGLLFFFTFWPEVICIVIGVVRVRMRNRRRPP